MNCSTCKFAAGLHRSILLLCLLSLLRPVFALTVDTEPGTDNELAHEIDSALDVPGLQTGFQGIVIQSLRDQSILYSRNADQVFLPASNNKLLTSGAALALLGPSYVYHTRVFRIGKLSADGNLNGDLYLRGSGDPLLMPADLDALATQIRLAGIQRVSGRLHFDDTLFDRQWLGDTWAWDDEPYYYSAQISALNVNENLINLRALPGHKVGAPVRIEMSPTSRYARIVNHAVTGPAKSKSTLVFDRPRGLNQFVISGSLPIDIAVKDAPKDRLTIENPARYAAYLFMESLQRAGVKVEHDDIADGPATPKSAEQIAEQRSMPLSELLKKMNKPSDNLVAECLLKTIGAEQKGIGTGGADGTGARVAKEFFLRIGLDTDRVQQADGSGLSRTNFVSPRNMVRLLAHVYTTPDFNTLYDSLPIAGIDGSLSGRMKSTAATNNCHAKTGYVSNVSSLSGFVTTRDGEMLVFSILMNNHLASNVVCTAAQDRIVNLLANFTRSHSAVVGQTR
jgi:D-alanyl-D-alanine carboxypeptidase/D-alanyl-D-alanine-endopeptidase (penicillin-binding protein 4)